MVFRCACGKKLDILDEDSNEIVFSYCSSCNDELEEEAYNNGFKDGCYQGQQMIGLNK